MGNESKNNTNNSKHFEPLSISEAKSRCKRDNTLTTLIFYLSILFFIIGFNFTDTPTPFGWYQQFMPNLSGATVSDVTFVDSLNGFATTLYRSANDSAFILKTTNGGDNWNFNTSYNYPFYRIQFINQDTGFALSFQTLFKTTNKGVSWQIINIALSTAFVDMYVLNANTIWGAASESLSGGVFLTTNGGVSWQQQFSGGNQNPNKIYMFNARIGFMGNISAVPNTYKTTNSGLNWSIVLNKGFNDMFFTDSLKGWTSYDSVRMTTNGGIAWQTQVLPYGGTISSFSRLYKFAALNKDTLLGAGGYMLLPNSTFHGIIYKTLNGGTNWGYQIPDTSIHIPEYIKINFINKNIGWAYTSGAAPETGIHTLTGGDSTIYYTSIKQISNEIPKEFELKQNFPNPFNPVTNIRYNLKKNAYVILKIYDITGREFRLLVNEKQTPGVYQYTFEAGNLSSGVYFYKIEISTEKEVYSQTKKMVLLK
jgi:photosystem II stability/assembly factor-like uncharacterized protein